VRAAVPAGVCLPTEQPGPVSWATIYIGEDGSSDFVLLRYDLLLTPYVSGETVCNPDATWNDSESLGGIVFSDNALPLNGVTTHTAQYLTRGTGWVDGTTTVTVEEK